MRVLRLFVTGLSTVQWGSVGGSVGLSVLAWYRVYWGLVGFGFSRICGFGFLLRRLSLFMTLH